MIEAAPVFFTVIFSGRLVSRMATLPKLYDEGVCVVCAPARTEPNRPVTDVRVRIASVLKLPRRLRPHFDIAIASVAFLRGVTGGAWNRPAGGSFKLEIELSC